MYLIFSCGYKIEIFKPVMVAYACNPSTGEVEAEGSRI
jgi:hypothetical protein